MYKIYLSFALLFILLACSNINFGGTLYEYKGRSYSSADFFQEKAPKSLQRFFRAKIDSMKAKIDNDSKFRSNSEVYTIIFSIFLLLVGLWIFRNRIVKPANVCNWYFYLIQVFLGYTVCLFFNLKYYVIHLICTFGAIALVNLAFVPILVLISKMNFYQREFLFRFFFSVMVFLGLILWFLQPTVRANTIYYANNLSSSIGVWSWLVYILPIFYSIILVLSVRIYWLEYRDFRR